jgi:hypothetical protein
VLHASVFPQLSRNPLAFRLGRRHSIDESFNVTREILVSVFGK